MQITYQQYKQLQGFYMAVYNQYHHGIKTNFGHWANLLDVRGIPWQVQNTVANLADDKGSNSYYLSTLLSQKQITIH